MKKKSKIIHDSDESDVEIFSVNEDSPKDNSFKDIAPTVIYQLHEDNISKLMEDRENGIYPVQRKKGLEKETGRGKLQGCSLGHMQQKSTNGRLLKKRMRSLSLTDSDVESVKDEMIMTHPLSRSDSAENLVPKGHELIVLESDDEIPPTRKNGAGNLKSQPIAVGESEEEEEGSVDEDGSFQSEASDDEGSDRQLESESDDGGKWYGSGSEESEDGGRRSRRRGSDDEKTEIELRIEMERKCRRILQRCADVSKLLRQALISWSQDTSSSSHIGTCVNLISMGGQNSNIISQDLIIQNISPQLVLKDYQLVGLNWLKLMHTNDVNGVLADDMGLGCVLDASLLVLYCHSKTVQTIGFVGWLHFDRQSRKKIPQTHLIVVPASTLTNWTKEFSRFCPHLKVVRFHGTVEEKYRIKQKLKRMLLDRSRSKGSSISLPLSLCW